MNTIQLTRDDTSRFEDAVRREWLVTNGLGGFASGTIAGARTRRYHGLLVAALSPPVERTVLVAKLDVTARYAGVDFPLGTNEYAGGTIDPHGYRQLEGFRLDGSIPVWTWACADMLLEQRVWMEHGRNTTYVELRVVRASGPVRLELAPMCAYRDYHAQGRGGWQLGVEPLGGGCRIQAFEGARPYLLLSDRGDFDPGATWYWRFRHRVESERGLDDSEDLFRPGLFRVELAAGQSTTLVASTEPDARTEGSAALAREQARQAALLERLPRSWPAWVRGLGLAADQFIVQRGAEDAPGRTVIAGYPWFSDWGRDTMIALPGLTLAAGRPELAAEILRTFARHVSEGMLPNRFPDAGETPEYNTVDATLWYFDAIDAYQNHTGDATLLAELYPVLCDIVEWHLRGTRYGIHVDPEDGLLYAGEPGVQLTWMDAKVGDWVVTPRAGKPVEINALWVNALSVLAGIAGTQGDAANARRFAGMARRASMSFGERFWYPQGGYLYDVVDAPDGERDGGGRVVDTSLRPNQIIAAALPRVPLGEEQARAVVDTCARALYTPLGLRSLAAHDPRYTGIYRGGPLERDGAYHQGTVWSWLLGPFARAHFLVYRDAGLALSFLGGLNGHAHDACLGTVSEIFDGDPPHTPRGCFAQAWGVAEALRCWMEIAGAGVEAGSQAQGIHR